MSDSTDTDINEFIKDTISSNALNKTKTIEILQRVQQHYGYLSRDSLSLISKHLRIPEIEIMGIATFYEQFRFNKPGKHTIKICEGTACHVRDGAGIGQTIERELGVGAGETTEDGMFSLERVACLGCCALAPVIVIDENIHGMMNNSKMSKLLGGYLNKEGGN